MAGDLRTAKLLRHYYRMPQASANKPCLAEIAGSDVRFRVWAPEDSVISAQAEHGIDGAVLSEKALVLRWFNAHDGDCLLVVNLGDEQELHPAPEPLLAPPAGRQWKQIWSSDDPRYDGPGAIEPLSSTGWKLPGESATLFCAEPVCPEK
jgi:maltooligosyltrehalose trehalohydrolase